jgi:hypothetical protein
VRKGLVRVGIPLAVFALALAVFLERAGRVGYNTDEGQFISTAQYFEYVFVDRDFRGPQWDETYWTLTQPPITRYILGAAIAIAGQSIPRVNLEHRIAEVRGPDRERFLDPRTFTDERRLAEERRIARPSPAVLYSGRLPMAIFAAGAIGMAFLVGRRVGGTVAGLATSLLFLWAPLSTTLMPRAHAEAPLIFFCMLSLWCAIRLVQSPRPWAWAVATGAAGGLAAGTKLTGLLAIAGVGAAAAAALAIWLWRREPATFVRGVWLGSATLIALATFVAVNPFMWPDPIARTSAMLRFRQQELVGQRALNVEDSVPESLGTRAALLLQRTFIGEAPIAKRLGSLLEDRRDDAPRDADEAGQARGRPWIPIDAALALIGVVAMARGATWLGAESVSLAYLVAFFGATAPNLGLDWQRYYLPTVAVGLVPVGVGVAVVVDVIMRAAWRGARMSTASPEAVNTANSGSTG